jgi:hypothetical protein
MFWVAAIFVVACLIGRSMNDAIRDEGRTTPILTPHLQDAHARADSREDDEPVTSATGTSYFRGMECTDDCGGHVAGYEWAQDNKITDEDDCSTNSDSFNEGCAQQVQETNTEPAPSADDLDGDSSLEGRRDSK